MEGYFPIYEYCKITGCKKDTAYHRANRGTVESFKGKDGRWFVYYSDNRELPNGFVTIKEYAEKSGLTYRAVFSRIKSGYFSDDETMEYIVIDENGHPAKRRLIKENALWIDRSEINGLIAGGILNSLRPKGTFTVPEYAGIINKTPSLVYSRIYNGKIHFVRIDGHYFIYPDEKEVTA